MVQNILVERVAILNFCLLHMPKLLKLQFSIRTGCSAVLYKHNRMFWEILVLFDHPMTRK